MRMGVDVLLQNRKRSERLKGKRVGFLGHPASITSDFRHSMDALAEDPNIKLSCAFGPQHGMRGDKQDNMIESDDYTDPKLGIPVFSLYGKVRRPTKEMLDAFDVLLIDLQDVGCRIYTYLSTLVYLLEDCAGTGKSVWVLDRPNPAGRPVEGSYLEDGMKSFVGEAPTVMRHGLTLGEAAHWYRTKSSADVELEVIPMDGYEPEKKPGCGWPVLEFPWVNPSPNASSLNMARCFCGTVLIEGTTLSEGRGTTTPLEVVGAPDIDADRILREMESLAPSWMEGAWIRKIFFETTFHKHVGKLSQGIQIHTDFAEYQHEVFRPYRLVALFLKALRKVHSGYDLWRKPPYEYEHERMPVDLLSGSTRLREWVDDVSAAPGDLDAYLKPEEKSWIEERQPHLMY